MIGVKRRIQHPNFRKDPSNKYDFDFGLMELERDILFDEFAQPIRMIHLGDLLPLPKTLIDVTGFGLYSNEHHRPSSVLRHISIPLNEFESCRQLYPRLSNNMFCAGWGTKMDSAKGDSGGKLGISLRFESVLYCLIIRSCCTSAIGWIAKVIGNHFIW